MLVGEVHDGSEVSGRHMASGGVNRGRVLAGPA